MSSRLHIRVFASLCLLVCTAAASYAAPTVDYLRSFGDNTIAGGGLKKPLDVAVDANGDAYVVDRNSVYLRKYGGNGSFLLPIDLDVKPIGFGTGTPGNLYVSDVDEGSVLVYDGTGNVKSIFGDLAFSSSDYVSNSIAVASNGDIYVVDEGAVKLFDNNGSLLNTIGSGGLLRVAVNANGNAYSLNGNDGMVHVINPSGVDLFSFGGYGTNDNQFETPSGIAVDPNGYVYVSDSNQNRVKVFTDLGAYITSFGSYGAGPAELNSPQGLAADDSGSIYVADAGNKRIDVFKLTTAPVPEGY